MTQRRLKTLNIALDALTLAGTYSYNFTADKDMQVIIGVAVGENKRNIADAYRIGIKPANGGEVVVDVCNRAFWVVDSFTPINERMMDLGQGGIIAQGYQYTLSLTLVDTLLEPLNLDVVFDQRN